MKRNDVIKALECCGNRIKADCSNCPMGEKRGCAIELYAKALEVIRQASDLAEGHWYRHDKKKHGDTCYYCSVCEKMALADCMIWELTNYCPNCGARMKGENDG